MALNLIPNFNRIIDLKFLTTVGGAAGSLLSEKLAKNYVEMPALAITCPRRGQKPAIEITGTFTTDTCIPAFNVTIKNLYMDQPNMDYPKLKVTAGYENKLQTFVGSILSMYMESPGPEGRTIIQCLTGTTEDWLDTTVTLQYGPEGFKLQDALQKIANALNMRLFTSIKVKTLIGKTSLQFTGKPQEAIEKLKTMFQDEQLLVTVRGDELRAYSRKDKTGLNDVRLSYLSAPPQQHAGSDGVVYATLTAPWEPTLRPGDKLTYNTWQFMKNYVTNTQKTASIIVDNIQFHFGTVGSVNQMIVQGHAV